MNRYEILIFIKKFDTCKGAFASIGLLYNENLYACYNEAVENRELCPFAENDNCKSKELPEHKEESFDALGLFSGIV